MTDPRQPITWEEIAGLEETLFSHAADGAHRCREHGEPGARVYTLTAGPSLRCAVCRRTIKSAVAVEEQRAKNTAEER